MAKDVSTYIVGSPSKHTIYLVYGGAVVQHILPPDLEKETPTPEEGIEPEGSTPPIDIPIPNVFIPLTGEHLDCPTAVPGNDQETQTDGALLMFDIEL